MTNNMSDFVKINFLVKIQIFSRNKPVLLDKFKNIKLVNKMLSNLFYILFLLCDC